MLTLMSDSEGKISVKARGALRKGSRTAAATQQLCYSEMVLFGNRGRWTVNEASVKEDFSGLHGDICDFSLGCYFAECIEAMSVEDQPEPELMQLILNCLYALSRRLYPAEQIKAAFELRLMCLAGYTPELSACSHCGEEKPERPMLLLDRGCISCENCAPSDRAAVCLGGASLQALRHICTCPPKQILSFSLEPPALRQLCRAGESYLLTHTERKFSTLEYWKNLRYI